MISLDRRIALFCIFALSVALLGCKAQYHIERAEKHREKALNKGAEFKADTTYVHGDTITTTYWKDSILYVDRKIVDTIFIKGEVVYITRKDKRIARKTKRLADKRQFKLQKQENRLEAKVNKKRSWWWLWYGLGILTTVLIKQLWNKYLRFFFR